MKRKIITAILAITVVFSAASCGSAENKSSNTQEATVSDMQNSTERVSEAAGDTQSEEMTATVNDGENVPGSGTSKSDTSDAAASSSADSKNADSTVKKNSSDSKSSTKNSTSTAVNHNSTQSTGASTAKTDSGKKSAQSSGASNQTKPASAAGSKGTDSSAGTANKPATHTHTWVKYVANTIQHKEEGHYETKVVKAAYDEPQYDWHNVCNKCGKDLGTDDWNVINHGDICDGSYSCIQVQVGTIHHDAETTQVWVVDKPAYTEYVYGEKCSVCGATK
ncbi:hypothetical protein [Agathobacter rectalis]|uniref:hypothetical protein n=1 Tax=Agathobacter rectalis TaxID=39491 RepID=UPI0032BFD88A